MDAVGDLGSGDGSGEVVAVATSNTPLPSWLVALVAVVAVIAAASWLRRRWAVSLLILLWAFATVGNLSSMEETYLGMDNDYWRMVDYGIGLFVDLVALLYVFSAHSPCVYLLGVLTVILFVADAVATASVVLHVSWHVVAFVFLGLIPGQLPMSSDNPDYYYERRRQLREARAQHVPVPQSDDGDWQGQYWYGHNGGYPPLYIPRGENYFQ